MILGNHWTLISSLDFDVFSLYSVHYSYLALFHDGIMVSKLEFTFKWYAYIVSVLEKILSNPSKGLICSV